MSMLTKAETKDTGAVKVFINVSAASGGGDYLNRKHLL